MPASAILLASGQAHPAGIAVDGENVYWNNGGQSHSYGGRVPVMLPSTDGSVMKCAIGGCNGAPTALVSGITGMPIAGGFAVGGGDVFWSQMLPAADSGTSDAVVACATAGCGGNPILLSPGGAFAIATDNENVFWTGSGTVMECAVDGCNAAPTSFGSFDETLAIAVDNTDVYFMGGGLWTCPKSGCNGNPTNLLRLGALALDSAAGLAVDGNNIYWASGFSQGQGAIIACPKTGCRNGPPSLVSGLNSPYTIATDGVDVYWIDRAESAACAWPQGNTARIARCAVTGCNNQPTVLASQLADPLALTVDNQNVYWTDTGTGEVWQMPK